MKVPSTCRPALDAPARLGGHAGVQQRHFPVGRAIVMQQDIATAKIDGHVAIQVAKVREIILDILSLVAAGDDEIIQVVRSEDVEDMPEDGPSADLHHRLGADSGFLGKASSESPGQNDHFHDESYSTVT